MDDDMIAIPVAFWEPFAPDDEDIISQHDAGGGIVTELKDGRKTYVNWLSGTFAVRQPDGTVEQYNGIMFDRDELMRAFPPVTIQ